MTPKAAIEWLVQSGCAQRNELGLVAIVKPPSRKHLHTFVGAIKTLGAYSVETERSHSSVEVSCGGAPYSLVFRLK